MTKLPKAILFDLDDTIISYSHATEKAWVKCCEDFIATEKVSLSNEDLLNAINTVRDWYWSDPVRHKTGRENLKQARREVVQYAFRDLGWTDVEKANNLADRYTGMQQELFCLFDGAYEALQKLSDSNIRMGVITNGSSKGQRDKLERFDLYQFFELILIDTEVGFSKPDIRIFELALAKLELPPEEVWMIGDNPVWDIESPKKLGIYTIWNDCLHKGLSEYSTIIPDKTVHSIAELVNEIIKEGE